MIAVCVRNRLKFRSLLTENLLHFYLFIYVCIIYSFITSEDLECSTVQSYGLLLCWFYVFILGWTENNQLHLWDTNVPKLHMVEGFFCLSGVDLEYPQMEMRYHWSYWLFWEHITCTVTLPTAVNLMIATRCFSTFHLFSLLTCFCLPPFIRHFFTVFSKVCSCDQIVNPSLVRDDTEGSVWTLLTSSSVNKHVLALDVWSIKAV